jgi:HTH-type transcriptional regulator, glycine betaine synthesis regulator
MCGSFVEIGLGHRRRLRLTHFIQCYLKSPNDSKKLTSQARATRSQIRGGVRRPKESGNGYVLTEVELEVIDVCVRAAQAFGVSRSIGEIFGLIFCAPRPVNFDHVVRALGISSGSASHGLRRMCQMGIIRSCYVARDRRVHYELKASLRGLVSALLEENLLVPLGMADEQIDKLRSRLDDASAASRTLLSRIELLATWNAKFRAALKPMMEALG